MKNSLINTICVNRVKETETVYTNKYLEVIGINPVDSEDWTNKEDGYEEYGLFLTKEGINYILTRYNISTEEFINKYQMDIISDKAQIGNMVWMDAGLYIINHHKVIINEILDEFKSVFEQISVDRILHTQDILSEKELLKTMTENEVMFYHEVLEIFAKNADKLSCDPNRDIDNENKDDLPRISIMEQMEKYNVSSYPLYVMYKLHDVRYTLNYPELNTAWIY